VEKKITMTAGQANGNDSLLQAMFPEGTMSLSEADPELYGMIKDEKWRQRCVPRRLIASLIGNGGRSLQRFPRFVIIIDRQIKTMFRLACVQTWH